MEHCKFYISVLLLIIFQFTLIHPALSQNKKDEDFPEFEFDIWGSAPSFQSVKPADFKLLQKILYCIKDHYLSSPHIAEKVGETESLLLEMLKELERYDIVKNKDNKWISNIPLYMEKEIRESEEIGLKYAEKEAEILRNAIPQLEKIYSRTTVSHYFPWDKVSLIIVGALLADFCVIDRIPFRPENFTEELQPRLKRSDGSRWEYTGFEKLPKRFPSRKWKFYQNVSHLYRGGTSRFGYYRDPNEKRKRPPTYPEDWFSKREGKVLCALVEGPLDLKELRNKTGLKKEILTKKLDEMAGYTPPAVILKEGKYYSKIPILTKSDLSLLLPECDKIAEEIFNNVVLPHNNEVKEKAKEIGYRWPLPKGTYVRDKALQILVEEGLLTPVQEPPVDWNFCFWGWMGFIAMHNEITEDLKPDFFLKTAISSEEKKLIEEFNSIKENILKSERFLDTSTPTKALLTRICGWFHADVKSLKAVEVPNDYINATLLEQKKFKKWGMDFAKLNIRRVSLPKKKPKDGDVIPIFTINDEGYEEVHTFFYYKGSWKALYNTNRIEFWHRGVKESVKNKLSYLESKRSSNNLK